MPSRRQPDYHRIDVSFDERDPFPAAATIAFEFADGTPTVAGTHVTVPARKVGTWAFTVEPRVSLPSGAQVVLRRMENDFRWAWRYQDYWPDASNYVTVQDELGESLPFECDTILKSNVFALVTLPNSWAPGKRIVVNLGDRRFGGRGSYTYPYTYERARVAVGVRYPGAESFRLVSGSPVSAKVVPLPPVKRYYFHVPSTARPGERFVAIAMPVDVNGNVMPGSPHAAFKTSEGCEITPTATDLHSVYARLALPEPGVARLRLEDHDNSITALSNPVRVREDIQYNTYWGEFHWHGFDGWEVNVLNENTHPDKAFRYGRDVTRLDFAGAGSHIFRHAPDAVHEWWELYRQAAIKYDEPGRYVPILGAEWRDRIPDGGDRNVIYRDLDAPVPDPTWKIDQMYELFRGQPIMITPHVGGAIALPYRHDPDVERLCEMVSGHGNFEWFAQEYLAKGYRLGLIGGSDGHRGTPGHPRSIDGAAGRWPGILRLRDSGYSGGPLLAVMAERLDRESLWEAFRARRTYASTGARALVSFSINGAPMGSEIRATSNCKIEIAIEGTAPVERVDLIRDQSRLARWEGDSDMSFAQSLLDRPPDGIHYYYARVQQADDELLWTSPIWIESTCGGDMAELPAWNAPEEIDLASLADRRAAAYLDDFLAYLRLEENPGAFGEFAPYKIVDSPMGSYAVFLGYFAAADGVKRRIRVHWYFEIESPCPRFEIGWAHYGRERIMGTPWAKPLIPGMDNMGG